MRIRNLILALLTVCLALTVICQPSRPDIRKTPLTLDFRDPGTGGGKAFFLLSQARWPESRIESWDGDWRDSSRVVLSLEDLSEERLDELLHWVRGGGKALVLMFHSNRLLLSRLSLGYRRFAASPPPPELMVWPVGPRLLTRNGEERLWAERPLGKGSITLLTDPWIFSNEALDLRENSALAWRMVSGPATFLIQSRALDWKSRLLASGWTRTGVVLGLILFGLLVRNQNLEWGRRTVSREMMRQRSMMDYVDAAAWLYESRSATRLALESIYRGARLRLSRRSNSSRQASPPFVGDLKQTNREFAHAQWQANKRLLLKLDEAHVATVEKQILKILAEDASSPGGAAPSPAQTVALAREFQKKVKDILSL